MPKLLRLCLWQVVFISIISFHLPVSAYEEGGIRMRGDKSTDAFSFDKYGPITSKDTLWNIASKIRPDSSLSIYQVMQALYQANPQAFAENNRNHIIEGQYLTIPSKTQMMATNALDALQKSDQDDNDWENKTLGTSKRKTSKANVNKNDLYVVKSEINTKLEKIDMAQQQRLSSIQNDVLDSIDGLQAILKENASLNQKLTSFDEQLGLMQTEVAKGKEMKLQMDDMLHLQQELLMKAKARENELLLEKERTELAEQGITSNLWFLVLMITVSVSVMFGVLFFILRRKKNPEETSFDEVKLNSQNNIAEIADDVEEELSLDAELSLDNELSLDDDLSADLLESDDDDDVIHLDIGDDDELEGLDALDDLDELDDLDDILLDNDELEGGALDQGELDSLLSVNDEDEDEAEPLDDGLLDQSALDDLLNGGDVSVDKSEPEVSAPEAAPVDVTDPDDIDALLDSIGVDASETEASAPEAAPVDVTDPDDIDALLDSIGVDASETEASAPEAAPVDVTDPDDIDALLDSIGVDASETEAEPAEITDPDDIDALLESMDIDSKDENTEVSSDTKKAEVAEDVLSENKEKIDNLTQEYVAPLLSADFSKIVNKSNEQALDSDLDMEKLLSESSEDSSEKGIKEDFKEENEKNDSTLELTPDFTDKNVLAELLNSGDEQQKDEMIEASEIEDIQELDNLDFDELLANIEEESNLSTSTDDFNEDLDVGDVIATDDKVDVKSEENFRTVDSILTESMDDDATAEPYDKANIDVGLDEFKELTTETEQVDVDKGDDIAAKLELANVYIEIGDEDNAKVMLLDVVKNGNKEQQSEAQKTLDSL